MVGAEAAEFVLSSHMEHFSWASGWPETFKILLGRSLFLQDGEEHRQKRKLLIPAFHGPTLPRYFEAMHSLTQSYLQKWEKLQQFRWYDEFKQLTFAVASELLLGASPGDEAERLSRLSATLGAGLATVPLPIPGTPFAKAVAARQQILEHLNRVVRERQQQPTGDALSLLVQARDENGLGLSQEELVAQALLLVFAGHETTTTFLTWACLELGRHPEVLTRARQEQQALAKSGSLSMEQLKSMPYLEQILLEVERCHPPVRVGFRGVVKPFVFQGYYVPAGWLTYYAIAQTHNSRELYREPERFDPDRFGAERTEQKHHPFGLIGFGGGPRICLGMAFAKMEIKIILSLLLRGYQWHILPGQSLETRSLTAPWPKDGLQVSFQPLI